MSAPTRTTSTRTTTTVRHIAEPLGRARENGPHLGDLRQFVAACEGLPDDLLVYVEKGHMGEGGRYNVTLSTSHTEPLCSTCGQGLDTPGCSIGADGQSGHTTDGGSAGAR